MNSAPNSVSLAGLGYRVLIRFCQTVPALLAKPLLRSLSFLYWICAGRARKTVASQLKLLGFPHSSSREVFFHFACFLYEFFSKKSPHIYERSLLEEQMTTTFGQPGSEGGLLLLPHTGNWELALRWLLSQGYPVSTVALAHSSQEIDQIFQGLRHHSNLEIYPLEHGARKCLKALKNNRIVALACERDYTGKGLRVDLDGFSTHFPVGPGWLMCTDKWKTALVECHRLSLMTINIKLHPFESEGDVREVTQSLAKSIYQLIRKHPSQWITFDPILEAAS
jgi:lauroyl/myristoyl acyltransferase